MKIILTIVLLLPAVLFTALGIHEFTRKDIPEHIDPNNLHNVRGHLKAFDEIPDYKSKGLSVEIHGTEIKFVSYKPYPSHFHPDTLNLLSNGERIHLILTREEFDSEPKEHRISKYKWKEFIGLAVDGKTLFTPERHYGWHRSNNKLGKYIWPALVALSLFPFYLKKRKSQQ